jgi:hypothetical protein
MVPSYFRMRRHQIRAKLFSSAQNLLLPIPMLQSEEQLGS